MGSAYAGHPAVQDARKLGQSIYAAAKKLRASVGMPGEPTQWGGRLPEGLAPKLMPHHSTDIYAGMVKNAKAYENATQNNYQTFRMISESVPEKFHHPGVEAAHIADDVVKYVETMIPYAIAAALELE